MKKNKWFANAVKSCYLVVQSPWLLIGSVIADLAFLFFIGIITTPLRELLVEKIVLLGAIVSRNMYSTGSVLQQVLLPDSRPLLSWAVLLWLSVMVITYLLYSLLQGSAWFCCSRMVHNAKSWYWYVQRFAIINLFWLGVYAILNLLDVYLSLRYRFLTIATQTSFTNIPGVLLLVVSAVLVLAALFSYAALNLGAGFHMFFDFRITAPLAVILGVLGLNIDFVLAKLGMIHPFLLVSAGVFVLLPLFALVRVYIILISEGKHVGT